MKRSGREEKTVYVLHVIIVPAYFYDYSALHTVNLVQILIYNLNSIIHMYNICQCIKTRYNKCINFQTSSVALEFVL